MNKRFKFKNPKLIYVIIAIVIIILLLVIFNIKNIIAQSQSLIVSFKNKLITVTYNPQSYSGVSSSGGGGGGDVSPGPDDTTDSTDDTDSDV